MFYEDYTELQLKNAFIKYMDRAIKRKETGKDVFTCLAVENELDNFHRDQYAEFTGYRPVKEGKAFSENREFRSGGIEFQKGVRLIMLELYKEYVLSEGYYNV